MKGTHQISSLIPYKTILVFILRIAFSLGLCTLGFTSMDRVEAQNKPQRMVKEYPVDRAKLEQLQRWVNEGHDTWCRDPKLVASAVLNRVAPEVLNSEFELVSLPSEKRTARGRKSIYTFASPDGRTSYQVTLRRYRWLLPAAGTTGQMVWVPVRIEMSTRPATD